VNAERTQIIKLSNIIKYSNHIYQIFQFWEFKYDIQ